MATIRFSDDVRRSLRASTAIARIEEALRACAERNTTGTVFNASGDAVAHIRRQVGAMDGFIAIDAKLSRSVAVTMREASESVDEEANAHPAQLCPTFCERRAQDCEQNEDFYRASAWMLVAAGCSNGFKRMQTYHEEADRLRKKGDARQ